MSYATHVDIFLTRIFMLLGVKAITVLSKKKKKKEQNLYILFILFYSHENITRLFNTRLYFGHPKDASRPRLTEL